MSKAVHTWTYPFPPAIYYDNSVRGQIDEYKLDYDKNDKYYYRWVNHRENATEPEIVESQELNKGFMGFFFRKQEE